MQAATLTASEEKKMWHWDDNKEQNFTNLRYLDMKNHLTLIADASSKGLGQMKSIYFILKKYL